MRLNSSPRRYEFGRALRPRTERADATFAARTGGVFVHPTMGHRRNDVEGFGVLVSRRGGRGGDPLEVEDVGDARPHYGRLLGLTREVEVHVVAGQEIEVIDPRLHTSRRELSTDYLVRRPGPRKSLGLNLKTGWTKLYRSLRTTSRQSPTRACSARRTHPIYDRILRI